MRVFFIVSLLMCCVGLEGMDVQEDVEAGAASNQQAMVNGACITQYRSKDKPGVFIRATLHAYPSGVVVEERVHCEGKIPMIRIDFMSYQDAEREYADIKRPHESGENK